MSKDSKNYAKGKNYKKRSNKQAKGYTAQSKETNVSNDVRWWSNSPLYEQATRVPFNRIAGDVVDWSQLTQVGGGHVDSNADVHRSNVGINVMHFVPTVGLSNDVNSPLNRAFTSIYAGIYAKTTGAMQFTQASMALITMAVDSIVTMIGMCKRALAASMLYNSSNFYYPQALVTAMGVDFEDIMGRQDEYIRKLNSAIMSLNAIKAVNLFGLTARHYQLVTNVYAEADNIKAPLHLFVPEGYYLFKDDSDRPMGPEILEWVSFKQYFNNEFTQPLSAYIEIINAQLAHVRHSSAFGLVAGSIQRAFPDAELLSIEPMNGQEVLVPVFDQTMLLQICNATVLTDAFVNGDFTVYEDIQMDTLMSELNGPVRKREYNVYAHMCTSDSHILRSPWGGTDPVAVMEGTRLMVMGTEEDAPGDVESSYLHLTQYGTEVVIRGTMYYYTKDESGLTLSTVPYTGICDFDIATIGHYTRFQFFPLVRFITDSEWSDPIGNMGTWTTIDRESLDGLHEAAMLSLYNTDNFVVRL